MYYFSATEPEFAALMALIYAHRAFFSLFFLYLLCFSKQDDLCQRVSGETENRSHYKKKDRENGGGGGGSCASIVTSRLE